ncbi:SusE domain-containing protein [Persicobacter psychrovividus]
MRNHIIYIYFLAMTMMLSCTTETMDPVGNWDLSKPVATSPKADSKIVLNEETPNTAINFSWEPASNTAGYGITYSVVLDTAGSSDLSHPILAVKSGNAGTDLSLKLTHKEIDDALALAGFPVAAEAKIAWYAVASSLSKNSMDSKAITFTRFVSEELPTELFIGGTATEVGEQLANAASLKRLLEADGNPGYQFEVYHQLNADEAFFFYNRNSAPAVAFGGADGTLEKGGNGITVAESGVYRIKVDLESMTYDLMKVEHLSVVGDAIEGGWGGDEPIAYEGNGVFKGKINILQKAGFVFRLNGDWDYLIKQVVGTANELVMENDAEGQGLEFMDIPFDAKGAFIFTVDLSGDGFTYTYERDPNGGDPMPAPDNLYFFADGVKVFEFTKDENTFTAPQYIAMQTGVNYTINAAEDGSGDGYSILEMIGETQTPEADWVNKGITLIPDEANMTVARDQAYMLELDFSVSKFNWSYYNLKLFHWDDANSGWDDRIEAVMTYSHPFTFRVTTDLSANFDSKINSPWAIQFGAQDGKEGELSGTAVNGGNNFLNITKDGSYEVSIVVAEDYQTGQYAFTEQ